MDPSLILLFCLLLGGLALTLHIGTAIGVAVLAACWYNDIPFALLVQKCYDTFDSFPLMALPFFVLAGDIMQRGSMARALLDFASTLVRHITGGLSLVSVLTCLFYGALCGSPPATTAAVGGILIPPMEKEGYSKTFATSVNSASGCLGALIPPSTPAIIFGATAGCSISDLFIGGILPGIVTGVAFMVLSAWISARHHYGIKAPRATARERLTAAWNARWALIVPFIVLGGIYTGITTPTEAGVVAAVYALLAETFINKTMTPRKVVEIFTSTIKTTGMIFYVIIMATAMGILLVSQNADAVVADMFASISTNAHVQFFLVATLILILGTFMEPGSIILLMTPILLPVVAACGMDPVHFGVIMVFGTVVGNITPPVGLNLYVGCGLSDIPFAALSRAILPYVWVMLIIYYVLVYMPQFALFLL